MADPEPTSTATGDPALATLVFLLILVSIPGNISSLLFFSGRLKHNLHYFLYAVMSVVDIGTCCFAVSPFITLVSGRNPVAYTPSWLCISWAIGAKLQLFFSMYVVLLMSVTRTIAIVAPFYKINRAAVIAALVVYGVGGPVVDSLFIGFGMWSVRFSSTIAGCLIEISPSATGWASNFYKYILMAELLIPSLAVFISFLISTMYIVTKHRRRASCDVKFKQASVTISIFTAVFLVCNFPFFIIHLLHNLAKWYNLEGVAAAIDNKYTWLVSQGVLPLINATINPCVYFTRISHFRRWAIFGLSDFVDNILLSFKSSSSSS